MAKRKVILYSAISLDGFIARKDGNIDWLPSTDSLGDDDQDYKDFYEQIDVTLMGRKTYEQVLGFPGEFPYAKTTNYVFSRQQQPSNKLVHFIHDHVEEFVNQLKDQPGKDIWLIGGGELNTLLLNANLIDELILTTIPTVLGIGIPLFGQQAIERQFKYSNTKIFPSGYVQVKYTK
jgi:dihydrofolate reductase